MSATSLGTGLARMMAQRDDENRDLDIRARTLLVPPELQQTAKELLQSDFIQRASNDLPTGNALKNSVSLEVEPRLSNDDRFSGTSTKAWYLFANHVDGPQAARFVLNCIQQRIGSGALRDQLEKRLRNLAEQHAAKAGGSESSHGENTEQAELAQVRQEIETVGRNLALAKSAEQYEAVSAVFDDLKARESKLATQLSRRPERPHTRFDPDREVEAALAVLGRLENLVAPDNQLDAKSVVDLVNARLFLSFKPTQVKKRLLNKLTMAVVTLGHAPPPVELYAGPTGRRGLKKSAAMVAAVTGETVSPGPPAGGEAISLGNVNRGDRI